MPQITLDALYSCTDGSILVAENKADRSRVHIDDTVSGLACQCVCPGCGRDMVARKGEVRAHVFAHHADQAEDCRPGESALHKFAKELLSSRLRLKLPAFTMTDEHGPLEVTKEIDFTFDEAALEKRTGEVIPDVICRRTDRVLHVEFLVTHACDPAKLAKIKAMQASVIEIDLSAFRGELLANLEDTILANAPRKWLLNPCQSERGASMLEERQIANRRRRDEEARRRSQKQDAEEQRLADIYDRLPDQADLPLKRGERKAIVYGLEAALTRTVSKKSCFTVREAEWKGFLLLRFGNGSKSFQPTFLFNTTIEERWVHRAFSQYMFRVPGMPDRIRRLQPNFLSPREAYERFLKDMVSSGWLSVAGNNYQGSQHLIDRIAARSESGSPDVRRDQLFDLVNRILRKIPHEDKVGFKFDGWLKTIAAKRKMSAEMLLTVNESDWRHFVSAFDPLESRLSGGTRFPNCETFGLPVQRITDQRRPVDRGLSVSRLALDSLGAKGALWAHRPSQDLKAYHQ